MFYVYVLQSRIDRTYYIGHTQNVTVRLGQHNRGKYQYTKGHRPWALVYQEEVKSRSEAVKRERCLKTGIGRLEIKKILSRSS